MDRCVLLTSTPECVVSPRRAITSAQPEWSPRGETTHLGVDVNNTHLSMINPLNDKQTACHFVNRREGEWGTCNKYDDCLSRTLFPIYMETRNAICNENNQMKNNICR